MPDCPVTQFDFLIDLESSSVSGHDVRITVDEAVIDEDDGGKCLKTLSVLPNNIFIQEHQKNTDISPTLGTWNRDMCQIWRSFGHRRL